MGKRDNVKDLLIAVAVQYPLSTPYSALTVRHDTVRCRQAPSFYKKVSIYNRGFSSSYTTYSTTTPCLLVEQYEHRQVTRKRKNAV
jgi:hypothetical protein